MEDLLEIPVLICLDFGCRGGRFQIGENLTTHSFEEAFQISLSTWAKWMEKNIDPATTQVFFRSFASVHFRYEIASQIE